MKKLILSLLVSFLFVSCSKNKENTALENCATETMNISGSSHLWISDEDFILLSNELMKSLKQVSLWKDKFDTLVFNEEEEINQYYLTNPSPLKPSDNLLIIGNDEQKTKNKVKWEKEMAIWSYWKAGFDEHKQKVEKKYITEKKYISESLEKEKISLNLIDAQMKIIKQNKVNEKMKKINKMNLSEKKKLPDFISAHHACELIYKINKKTFILEYGG